MTFTELKQPGHLYCTPAVQDRLWPVVVVLTSVLTLRDSVPVSGIEVIFFHKFRQEKFRWFELVFLSDYTHVHVSVSSQEPADFLKSGLKKKREIIIRTHHYISHFTPHLTSETSTLNGEPNDPEFPSLKKKETPRVTSRGQCEATNTIFSLKLGCQISIAKGFDGLHNYLTTTSSSSPSTT